MVQVTAREQEGRARGRREDKLTKGRAGLGTECCGEKQDSQGSLGDLHVAGQQGVRWSSGQAELTLGTCSHCLLLLGSKSSLLFINSLGALEDRKSRKPRWGEADFKSLVLVSCRELHKARKALGRHKGSGYLQQWFSCLLEEEMVPTVRGGEILV